MCHGFRTALSMRRKKRRKPLAQWRGRHFSYQVRLHIERCEGAFPLAAAGTAKGGSCHARGRPSFFQGNAPASAKR